MPIRTSAQKTELIALTRALLLVKNKKVNIYIDFKYKKKGLLTVVEKRSNTKKIL